MATRPLPDGGLPRVSFEAGPIPIVSPLRTDIAIFVGPVQRGPVGTPIRIDAWRAFEAVFGGLWSEAYTPYAIRGYFENGGLVAYVLRVAPGALPASTPWIARASAAEFAPEALKYSRFVFLAATPGSWANGLTISPAYRRGVDGAQLFDFDVRLDGEVAERLFGLRASALAEEMAARSSLIRIRPDTSAALIPAQVEDGPLNRRWTAVTLGGGTDGDPPTRDDYLNALTEAAAEPEPAMIGLPDLHGQFDADGAVAILLAASRLADARLDRLVIADAPEGVEDSLATSHWIDRFGGDPAVHRATAAYHPWILVRDPLGTPANPLRAIPPCGHVAGAISTADRDRGPYITPANMSISGAVDLSRRPDEAKQGEMNGLGLNALRCQSGRGITIWGGRMLRADDSPPRFVAHRRLINRLVRALRRVWEPMVFENNDDTLRFAIGRSASTLLTEAFHSGVLKGTRPEEAFQVDVGDQLNDATARDAGRVICDIAIAPAVPMEFIHFRVGISREGNIDLIET